MVPLLGYLSILLTILPNFSFTAKKKKKKCSSDWSEGAACGWCIAPINSLCNFSHSLENIWAQQTSNFFSATHLPS